MVFGIATAFFAVMAVWLSPWWALAAVASLALLVSSRLMPQRVALRVAALDPEASEGPVTPDQSTNVAQATESGRPNG